MLKYLSAFNIIKFCTCYWSGAASIAGSVISGAIGSKSAKNAAKESSKATGASNEILQQQANENTAAYKPYTDVGAGANAKLADYLGISTSTPTSGPFDLGGIQYQRGGGTGWQANLGGKWTDLNPATTNFSALNSSGSTPNPRSSNFGSLLNNFDATDLANDPVYNSGLQFGLDEGTKGINRLASANGGIDSGATLKALTRYANDYGSTKAQGAFQNFNTNKNNIYNMLSGQSAQGLSATSALQGNNSNLRTGTASNVINNGTNQGNAAVASGAAWGNAINNGIGNYVYGQRTEQPSNGSIYGNQGTFGSGSNPNGSMSYNNSAWYNNNTGRG